MNNAVRHASPRRVDVELEDLNDELRVLSATMAADSIHGG